MKWIESEKISPPEDGQYLVYIPSPDEDAPKILMLWYNSNSGWGLIPSTLVKGITHWMKLEPPKKKPVPPPVIDGKTDNFAIEVEWQTSDNVCQYDIELGVE